MLVGLLCALVEPPRAAAHADLNRAIRLSAELDFDKALRAFEKALASGTLTRDELVQLLSERALLLHALRRRDDVVADFEWLAAIDPHHHLDQRAPPDLTLVWRSVRGRGMEPTRVELSLGGMHERAELRANVRGRAPEGLMVRTYYRRSGDTEYASQLGPLPVQLSLARGVAVEAYAELIGPGKVVFGGQASAEQPLKLWLSNGASMPLAGYDGQGAPQEHNKRKKWLWIGGVAAVVVTAIVIGAVAASGDDEHKTKLMPVASF